MKKFSLTFHNPEIERKYQIHQQITQRALSFNIVTFGFGISFAIRILTSVLTNDYTLFYYKIAMVIYLVLQYVIIRWKPQYTRYAFIVVNLTNLVLNLENDSLTTIEISYLKGANTMAINFLIIQAGEFPESIFVFTTQTAYRIITIFILGSTISFSVILTSILVNLTCFLYFYFYHKAKRSQYLLGLVDNCWDKILQELINQPYILLKFHYDDLKFSIEKINNFPFSFQNNQSEQVSEDDSLNYAKEFLRKASIKKKTLEQYIHQLIKRFQARPKDKYNLTFFIQYEKKLVEIDLSIFQAANPTIILKIKKQSIQQTRLLKKYKSRFAGYNLFIIKFLKGLETNYHVNNVKKIRRKLIQIQMLDQILDDSYTTTHINFSQILQQLEKLYPERILTFKNPFNILTIYTVSNIFLLLLMQILENANFCEVKIEVKRIGETIELIFVGSFQTSSIINVLKHLKFQMHLIMEKQFISTNCIKLLLYLDISFLFYPIPISSLDIVEYQTSQ